MGPTQAVDDITVLGSQLDGLLDHLEAAVQIFAPINPGIAEIVENQRLIGLEFERMQKIGLRRLPLARPLERDAPAVEQRPALRYAGGREAAHRLVIGLDRLGKALLAAQQ